MPFIDIDWLNDHVEVPTDETYEQLAKDLVHVGLEEEEIRYSTLTGPIVVGYVVDATPEPQKNGKVINFCHVDVGEYNHEDENGNKVPREIVCGAPNMAAGEKVVVTLPGAVLPGDFRIEPRKTYGHMSDGMCASERELGLGSDHNGIILLRNYGFTEEEYEALEPGQDAMELLKLNDPTLEINITPDRGYAFSYRGVAREFHHSTGATFTDPVVALNEKTPEIQGEVQGDIEVIVNDSNPIHGVPGCDRYYMRGISGIDANASTPQWMRRRLLRAGMRSISPAVDVTNYVMLDLGQPLHAYDADKIEAPIVVRRAVEGEKLITLDEKEHELSPEDLLITDSPQGQQGSRILGLAGVMGGLYGEVTSETTNVLIEAAHFDQVSIARTARRHKIPSEASRRFERGVDTKLQPAAAQQTVDLITSICGGTASNTPTNYDKTVDRTPIRFKTSEVERLTALKVEINEISRILTDIGCVVGGGGNGILSVVPPTWRPDLTYPCDLVEEIARIIGYDEIPVTVPSAYSTGSVGLTSSQQRRRFVANTLAEYGLVQVTSYPFVGDADFKDLGLDTDNIKPISVELENPLAADRPFLRRDILLTLSRTVQRNIRRGNPNVRLFEMGSVFEWDPQAPAIPALPGGVRPSDDEIKALNDGLPNQPEHVAGILTGKATETGWIGESRDIDWTDAVEIVRRISDRLGADLKFQQPAPEDVPVSWHPGRFAYAALPDGTVIGHFGELHPHVNETFGFPAHSAAFELDLTALFAGVIDEPLQAKPVSTYPPVHQDLAFTVPSAVTAAQLESVIRQAVGDALESIELFDVFTGEQVGEGSKSLAFAVTFRSQDKTLESSDSDALRAAIVEAAEKIGAQLRA